MRFWFANYLKLMGLIYFNIFLYQSGCDKIEDGIITLEERYLPQVSISCL